MCGTLVPNHKRNGPSTIKCDGAISLPTDKDRTMADFSELLAQLREPGEEIDLATVADALQSAYDETVSTHTDASASLAEQLAQETARANAADAAKATVQAHNARLLKSVPSGNDEQQPNVDQDKPLGGQTTIESLIEYK